jgi:hypothetical protein
LDPAFRVVCQITTVISGVGSALGREETNAVMSSTPDRPSRSSTVLQIYVILAVVAMVVLYLVAFLATELKSLTLRVGETMWRADILLLLSEPTTLIATWLGQPGEAGVTDRVPILLTAMVIVLFSAAVGWWMMSLLRADVGLAWTEIIAFAAGVGLNIVSLVVLLLGLLGWLNLWVFATIGVLTCAAAGWHWRSTRSTSRPTPAVNETKPLWSNRWVWLAAPAVVFLVLGGMLPPVHFDVREYHLQAPKEFFQQGHIGFLPHNVYAQMPLGAHMHSLLGMVILDDWWLGALVGKTVIAMTAPLTALAIWSAGVRFFSTSAAMVAAVLYLWIPWIAGVSMSGLIDGVSAMYCFLSVYAVLLACGIEGSTSRATETSDGQSAGQFSRFALAGFLAGGAVACKYPGVLFVLLPLAVWVGFACWSAKPRRVPPIKAVTTFLLAAACGCGLWFGKNLVLTGNPTYPLLYGWFGGESRTDELNQRWERVHRPQPYPDSHDGHVFTPHQAALYAAHVLLRSPWLAPVLVPLAALAAFAASGTQRRLVFGLLAYLLYVFLTWWLFTHRIDRFWVPVLPIVALLAGVGATWTSARGWRWAVLALLILSTTYGLICMTSGVILGTDRKFFVALEVLRRDPMRVDGTHLYLNERRQQVGAVLLVGDAQPFDLEVESVLYNTTFDPSVLVQMLGDTRPASVHRELLLRGVTHIYVHWGEIDRYRSPGNYGFAREIQPEFFQRLMFAGVLVALGDPDMKGRFRLFRVNPKPVPSGAEP